MDDREQEAARKRRRLMRLGALAGAVLALVCHCVPPQYQATCKAVAEITALTCGGGH